MMKSNKITVRILLLLGFGGTVGMLGSCGANRAQKSHTADPAPEPVEVQDSVVPIRVMYGVPAVRFDPDKPMLRRAMGRMITGSVTDADSGEALQGVIVEAVTEGKDIFAITDLRGRYSIDPGATDSLRFLYLGYFPETIKIKGDTLDVRMKIDSVALQTPIMVMYGVRPTIFDRNKPVPKVSE